MKIFAILVAVFGLIAIVATQRIESNLGQPADRVIAKSDGADGILGGENGDIEGTAIDGPSRDTGENRGYGGYR